MKHLRDAFQTLHDLFSISSGTNKRPWYVWVGQAALVPCELLMMAGLLLLMCICSVERRR
jgi:hypothetical protein